MTLDSYLTSLCLNIFTFMGIIVPSSHSCCDD